MKMMRGQSEFRGNFENENDDDDDDDGDDFCDDGNVDDNDEYG